jgi:hypothetical protein
MAAQHADERAPEQTKTRPRISDQYVRFFANDPLQSRHGLTSSCYANPAPNNGSDRLEVKSDTDKNIENFHLSEELG